MTWSEQCQFKGYDLPALGEHFYNNYWYGKYPEIKYDEYRNLLLYRYNATTDDPEDIGELIRELDREREEERKEAERHEAILNPTNPTPEEPKPRKSELEYSKLGQLPINCTKYQSSPEEVMRRFLKVFLGK